jgi:hypothetical protein
MLIRLFHHTDFNVKHHSYGSADHCINDVKHHAYGGADHDINTDNNVYT